MCPPRPLRGAGAAYHEKLKVFRPNLAHFGFCRPLTGGRKSEQLPTFAMQTHPATPTTVSKQRNVPSSPPKRSRRRLPRKIEGFPAQFGTLWFLSAAYWGKKERAAANFCHADTPCHSYYGVQAEKCALLAP